MTRSSRFGATPEPVTPYQKAAQVWDERLGSARVQAKNWRLMAFAAMGLAVTAVIGLLIQGGSRITPYVVEVTTSGEVRTVGEAVEAYNPTDVQIAHHIGLFIKRVRSLSSDAAVVRQNWLDAYAMATDRATQRLNAEARDNDPFANLGRVTVTVEIVSVVRISDKSFQARWRERRFENGSPVGVTSHTGVFTLVHVPPKTKDTLLTNPLGLYVHDLDWSKDLTPGDRS